ncbi:VOC family protein [Sporosarcina sp. PTS2304]|uniref:VOC family protein n=1 Tax=Sporosarcina sp. PTS2304 TaxID=2283194 RepID=UPI000E0CF420|nr:VOC family protein [Sporosarcina sp. PTS2304]AXI00347.1 VOC family protein [Sporosarcina sp. PTS2304]
MKVDHVVYFTTRKLVDIISDQQQQGNKAVIGGHHEQWGTANALLYTENAYIEWLTVENEELAKRASTNQPLVEQFLHDRQAGDGWATVCFSVNGMERWKEELDNKGFRTTSILDASRKTEDGRLLRWKMLFVEQEITSELPYPFFIEWEEKEDSRLLRLEETGVRTSEHCKKKITECVFHVEDPLKETGEWAVLLSQKVGDENTIQIGDVIFRFIETEKEFERLATVHLSTNG